MIPDFRFPAAQKSILGRRALHLLTLRPRHTGLNMHLNCHIYGNFTTFESDDASGAFKRTNLQSFSFWGDLLLSFSFNPFVVRSREFQSGPSGSSTKYHTSACPRNKLADSPASVSFSDVFLRLLSTVVNLNFIAGCEPQVI